MSSGAGAGPSPPSGPGVGASTEPGPPPITRSECVSAELIYGFNKHLQKMLTVLLFSFPFFSFGVSQVNVLIRLTCVLYPRWFLQKQESLRVLVSCRHLCIRFQIDLLAFVKDTLTQTQTLLIIELLSSLLKIFWQFFEK